MDYFDRQEFTSAIDRLTKAVEAQNKLLEQMGTMIASYMNYQITKDQKQEKREDSE